MSLLQEEPGLDRSLEIRFPDTIQKMIPEKPQ